MQQLLELQVICGLQELQQQVLRQVLQLLAQRHILLQLPLLADVVRPRVRQLLLIRYPFHPL